MVMDLDQYGVDVAVEAPPADQVADMSVAARRYERERVERVRIRASRRLTSTAWIR